MLFSMGKEGWRWTKGPAILVLILLMVSGSALGAGLDLGTMFNANPDFDFLDYYNLRGTENYRGVDIFLYEGGYLPDVTFMVDSNDIILAFQASFPREEWNLWFEQAENNPVTLPVEGTIYTQQVFLAPAEAGLNRGHIRRGAETLEMGEPVALNYHELRPINPALEFYEQLDPPVTEDGNFIFYAPHGSGIGFVTDSDGDIYALVRILVTEDDEDALYHPDLGEVILTQINLRDSEGKFDLGAWLDAPPEEVVQKDVADFDPQVPIEPGFFCKEINFQVLHGVVNITGTMLNETGSNYMMAVFEITFYDEEGVKLGVETLQVMNIQDGQEGPIVGGFPLDWDVDINELHFEIEFIGGN